MYFFPRSKFKFLSFLLVLAMLFPLITVKAVESSVSLPTDGTPAQVSITSLNDVKYYKIVVSTHGSLRINIASIPSEDMGLSYNLYKDVNGVPNTSSPMDQLELKTESIKSIDRSIKVSPGTYYVKLSGIAYTDWWYTYKGWSNKSFTISATFLDPENNDTSSTALEISSGYNADTFISASNDVDWYKINISNISSLHISINNIPAEEMGLSYVIYKGLNGEPDTSSPVDALELKTDRSFSLDRSNKVSPGTYYIKLSGIKYTDSYNIYSYKGWSTKSFKLNVHVFDEENNDTSSNATVVAPGTLLNASISAPNEVDWYKITASDISALRIKVSDIPYNDLGLKYVVYREKNGDADTSSPLDSFEVNPGSADSFDKVLRVTPGTYYIKTSGLSYSDYFNTYKGWSDKSFEISFIIFDAENNDVMENATKLQNEAELTGYISVPEDIDWYFIDVPQNSFLNLSLSDLYSSSLDYTIYRLNSNNTLSEVTSSTELEVTSGRYYIKVSSKYSGTWSADSYKIKVSLNNRLQAANNKTHVSLNWDAVNNAKSYTIMRSESKGEYKVLKVLDGNITSYSDYDVKNLTEYSYYVRTEGGLIYTSTTPSAFVSNVPYILYRSGSEIRYENLDNKNVVTLATNASDYYFNTSKQKLYYISSDGLRSINLDGTGDRLIISGIKSKTEFDVSADGNKILYIKDGAMYTCDDKGANIEMQLSGFPDIKDVKLLYKDGTYGYSYVVGEKRYVFMDNLAYALDKTSFISPDGSKAVEVIQVNYNKLFFLVDSVNNTRTLLKNIQEAKEVGIKDYYVRQIQVQWSPDGDKMALQTDFYKWDFVWNTDTGYTENIDVTVDVFDASGSKLNTIYNATIYDKKDSGYYLKSLGNYLLLQNNGTSHAKSFDSNNVWLPLTSSDSSASNITPVMSQAPVVYTKEDINQDGIVDIKDIASAAKYYNVKKGASGWDAKLDVNNDSIIDVYDLVIISKKFN